MEMCLITRAKNIGEFVNPLAGTAAAQFLRHQERQGIGETVPGVGREKGQSASHSPPGRKKEGKWGRGSQARGERRATPPATVRRAAKGSRSALRQISAQIG